MIFPEGRGYYCFCLLIHIVDGTPPILGYQKRAVLSAITFLFSTLRNNELSYYLTLLWTQTYQNVER